jgi:uncharacterized membrane protein YbhN (UPF0104 family)
MARALERPETPTTGVRDGAPAAASPDLSRDGKPDESPDFSSNASSDVPPDASPNVPQDVSPDVSPEVSPTASPGEGHEAPARPRFQLPVWARLLLAPLLFVGVLWAVDLSAVASQLRAARPGWLLASLACAVASNVAAAWRWAWLLRWLGHPLSLARATVVCLQAVALNALLPGAVVGGDLWRVAALRRRGQPLAIAGLSVVLDRFIGLWMVAVAGLFAAAWGLALQGATGPASSAVRALALPAIAAPATLAAALTLLLVPALLVWRGPRRRAVQVAGATSAALQGFALSVQRPQAGRAWVQQSLAAAAVHLLSVAGLACAARALGVELPYWVFVVAAVPIFLMSTLPISFGGWGTREAAAGLAFAAFGVAPAVGVSVAVIVGVLGLVQALAGGLLLALDRPRR